MSAHLGEDYFPLNRMAGPCEHRAESFEPTVDDHTEAGMEFIAGRLAEYKQHAAELAEAVQILSTVLIRSHGYTKKTPVVAQALAVVEKYKQTRGE